MRSQDSSSVAGVKPRANSFGVAHGLDHFVDLVVNNFIKEFLREGLAKMRSPFIQKLQFDVPGEVAQTLDTRQLEFEQPLNTPDQKAVG